MIGEQDLRDALRDPAWDVPAPTDPVGWVRARVRRQRAWLTGSALTAVAALSLVSLVIHQEMTGTERLMPAAAAPGGLAVRVVSAEISPPVAGLSVAGASYPVLLTTPYPVVSLAWTSTLSDLRVPDQPAQTVPRSGGEGELALVAPPLCPVEVGCAAGLGPRSTPVSPGSPQHTSLVVDPGRADPGRYDVAVPIEGTGSTLHVTLELAPAPEAPAADPALGDLAGTLSSTRPDRPLVISAGVPAGISLTNTRTGERRSVQSVDGTFTARLPIGSYVVGAGPYDADCPEQPVTVTAAKAATVTLACTRIG